MYFSQFNAGQRFLNNGLKRCLITAKGLTICNIMVLIKYLLFKQNVVIEARLVLDLVCLSILPNDWLAELLTFKQNSSYELFWFFHYILVSFSLF